MAVSRHRSKLDDLMSTASLHVSFLVLVRLVTQSSLDCLTSTALASTSARATSSLCASSRPGSLPTLTYLGYAVSTWRRVEGGCRVRARSLLTLTRSGSAVIHAVSRWSKSRSESCALSRAGLGSG